jgi:hypothetical protein
MKPDKNRAMRAGMKEEKEFGSFELAWDALTHCFKKWNIYMPLVAVFAVAMAPQVFFTPDKGVQPGIAFKAFGFLNIIIMFIGYAFFVFITEESEKKQASAVVNVGDAVKKTFSRLPWFFWTTVIFLIDALLFLAVCLSPALIAVVLLDVGPPVAMIFMIPGLYMLFALNMAPINALLGDNRGKNPVMKSWKATRGIMLEVFFALLAFVLITAVLAAAYMLASVIAVFIIKFLFSIVLGNTTGGIISGSIGAVAGTVFKAFLVPFFAVYGYKFFHKMEKEKAAR